MNIKFTILFNNGHKVDFIQPTEGQEEAVLGIAGIIQEQFKDGGDGQVTLHDGNESIIVKLADVSYVKLKEVEDDET